MSFNQRWVQNRLLLNTGTWLSAKPAWQVVHAVIDRPPSDSFSWISFERVNCQKIMMSNQAKWDLCPTEDHCNLQKTLSQFFSYAFSRSQCLSTSSAAPAFLVDQFKKYTSFGIPIGPFDAWIVVFGGVKNWHYVWLCGIDFCFESVFWISILLLVRIAFRICKSELLCAQSNWCLPCFSGQR